MDRRPASGSGPSRRGLVRAAVHEHAPAAGDPADHLPRRRRRRVAREGRGQRVVVAAGQHPVQRVDAERAADVAQLRRHLQPGRVQLDADPAGDRDVPEVGDQPVADVDHRGRAELGGLRALPRTAARGAGARRPPSTGRAEAADSTASPAAAQPSRPVTATTSPGRAPDRGHRRAALQVAERGDRDDQRLAAHQVAADARPRRPARTRPQPVGELLRPGDRQVRRARPGRPAARSARRPSRRCRRGSARPPCGRRRRRRPVPAEVPALDQHVGAWPPPARPARPPPPRRRRGRAGRRRLRRPGGDRAVDAARSARTRPTSATVDGTHPLSDPQSIGRPSCW